MKSQEDGLENLLSDTNDSAEVNRDDLRQWELLTPEEVCKLTKLAKTTVYTWSSQRKPPFPVLRLGRSVRFRKIDVLNWLKDKIENKG